MIQRPVWLDGTIVAHEAATASVLSHAMQRGSLVFDVATFGPRGIFRMREHIERLLRSARIVGLAVAHDVAALEDATRAAVRASELSEGIIRWSAFLPSVEPDLVPADVHARVAIAAYSPSALGGKPKPSAFRVAIFDDARKAAPEAITPLAKVSAAYLGPMLARRRAVAAGFDEVILLDRDGNVAETPTCNVFAVIGGELVTPALGNVLDGITRDSVLAIARAEGIAAREEVLRVDDLCNADEAFLTASSLPVAAIASVNETKMQAAPGPLTMRVKALLLSAQRGQDARFAGWLG
jgi:branched-chain amino acid aminotransferase